MGKWIYENVKSFLENIIEVILPIPRYCNGCGRQLKPDSKYQLCHLCETFVHEYHYNDSEQLDKLLMDKQIDSLAIACNYDDLAKELIYKIKYRDKRECAITMSAYMAKTILSSTNLDCIVPVPISKRKLKKRGYNHVRLIADELSKLINVPVYDCLIRIKDTKPQVLFNEQERWYNVKGCFTCNRTLENFNVLLIDDLITTGATIFYCASELKRFGASNVMALAFARSVRF